MRKNAFKGLRSTYEVEAGGQITRAQHVLEGTFVVTMAADKQAKTATHLTPNTQQEGT